MTVQFMDFITENRYDKLKIGTGDNIFDEGTVQVEASGNVLPTGFDTPSNLLWVTFFSDGEKTERGFSIEILDEGYTGKQNDEMLQNFFSKKIVNGLFPRLYCKLGCDP